MGKDKPAYAPHQDLGDYVVVVNADKVRLTGKKEDTKTYFRHSHYPGGGKFRSFREQMEKDPRKVISHAVWGMLPKTTLGRSIMKKLHVYSGDVHPHAAQKPESLSL
jgi:large subunit ribosomal protein L13